MMKLKKPIILLILIAFIFSACSITRVQPTTVPTEVSATEATAQTEAATETAPAAVPDTPVINAADIYMPPFAEYQDIEVNLPAKTAMNYSLPVDLGTLTNLDQMNLTETQKAFLAANGFVVADPTGSDYQEFYQVYESVRYNDDMIAFITTDSVYHVYHLLFNKILRDLETEKFIAMLGNITTELLAASTDQWTQLKGTALEDGALRNVAFFGVAADLLGLQVSVPAEAQPGIEAELALINASEGAATSPLWNRDDLPVDLKLIEDYSQYKPRGHYTRSTELEQYFRAMMWYGRMTLRLRDTAETQRALLLVQGLRDKPQARQDWDAIYQATAFLVGKADDLSFQEYGKLSDQVFGAQPELTAFADTALMAQFTEAAKQLPPPQVNSMWVWIWEDRDDATQGFRVMGQRFTLDAYVFGQVMWRNVGTMENPRDLPKAMDLLAAMGSEQALSVLQEMGESAYDNYDTQMTKVKGEVASLEKDSWTQNVYWSWLYSFFPLIEPKGEAYPDFMRTQAWNLKEINTALGSYTELKHDTILYAKQVMAEMGAGMMEDPPRNYVEPNPEAFARMQSLAQMTRDGLKASDLLIATANYNLDNLIDLLNFLRGVSEKQLNGETLGDEDYVRLLTYGGELEALTLAAADAENPDDRSLQDQKSALVADIATGVDRVLEEATGRPALIYVVSPRDPDKVAVGAVYTYYEFIVPPAERMTDETWWELVQKEELPPLPDWTSAFISK